MDHTRQRLQRLVGKLQNNDLASFRCSSEHEIKDVVDIVAQPNHTSLKYLYIRCEISLDCAILVANVLKINKSITELCFDKDSICCDGILAIFEALSNHNNTLTKLDLCRNAIDYTAILAVGRMLKTNKSLTKLDIRYCKIDSDGASVIGNALKVNAALQILVLEGNNIEDDGTKAIADGIKENDLSSLNVLNISSNNIGMIGANSIATMLAANKSLIELCLDENKKIGTDGVNAIVEALKQNRSLNSLALCRIPFGDDGARNIATVLAKSFSLQQLYMEYCNIGDAGAVAIADVLKTNKSLICLALNGNCISGSVVTNEFAGMLEQNTTLNYLYFGILGPIDADVAEVILKVLQDYNDTIQISMFGHGHSIKDILEKIEIISRENLQGIRSAPIKAERVRRQKIFHGLYYNWIHKIA